MAADLGAGAVAGRVPAPLDFWQRQAVLAAAALLRARFQGTPQDRRAKAVHDARLEVIDPARRAARLERELADRAASPPRLRSERRARGRRAGTDRRVWEFGAPRGRERRKRERRGKKERRA
jgi:hypothetical protein